MRIPRIYFPNLVTFGSELTIEGNLFHRIVRVLRMNVGNRIELFDGKNRIYNSYIKSINQSNVQIIVLSSSLRNRESPLRMHLGQAISNKKRMDFIIQKSVELGINSITPLISERCKISKNIKSIEKKMKRWKKIIIQSSEQCRRNKLMKIFPIQSIGNWCENTRDGLKLLFHPFAKKKINDLKNEEKKIFLLIGPEGGFSRDEIDFLVRLNFHNVLLGPRILRVETAVVAIISALQLKFGDFR